MKIAAVSPVNGTTVTSTVAASAPAVHDGRFTSIRDVAQAAQMRKLRSFANGAASGQTVPNLTYAILALPHR